MAASSLLPEDKLTSAASYESSTTSALTAYFFFVDARDDEGATEAESSRASVNSRPGHSPPSGWGRKHRAMSKI
jgi:hypothetical protein